MTFSTGQEGPSRRRWKPRPKGIEGAAYTFNHHLFVLGFFLIKLHDTDLLLLV